MHTSCATHPLLTSWLQQCTGHASCAFISGRYKTSTATTAALLVGPPPPCTHEQQAAEGGIHCSSDSGLAGGEGCSIDRRIAINCKHISFTVMVWQGLMTIDGIHRCIYVRTNVHTYICMYTLTGVRTCVCKYAESHCWLVLASAKSE